jgi:hypothetical protein
MEWETWFTISICWIWFLTILSIYWLQNGQILSSLVAAVLAVVEYNSVMQDPELLSPAASFVIAVVWYNQAVAFGRQCMETISDTKRATTSAFTTGMNALASCSSWSLKSLTTKCYVLLRSYATARTPLSTRTLSERYSDL